MDQQLALLLLDQIEKLELENKALIVLLPVLARTGDIARAQALLEKMKAAPEALALFTNNGFHCGNESNLTRLWKRR